MSTTDPLHPIPSAAGRDHTQLPWAELKRRVRIPQILADLGLLSRFRRRGASLVGPCPIHRGDNRNAFTVRLDRNLWFCFTSCGRGGTVIDLALALSDGSWARMCRWFSRLAAVPIAAEQPISTPAGVDPAARTFRPYRRAVVLDPYHPFFRRMDLRPDVVRQFEAGAWHGRGFLAGTVAIRLHDLNGEPLGYAGRWLDPETILRYGKWKWPKGFPKSQLLYNWHRTQHDLNKRLIVVEGAWSVMKLQQAGVTGAVALGGRSVSPTQRALLARARKLILFLDGDDTGRTATNRLLCDRLHPQMRSITCPSDLDPADLDEDTLRRLLGPDI